MSTPRTICQEAHERLLANEEAYGDLLELFARAAEAVSQRTGVLLTTETALWLVVELAFERHRRRPLEPDHLRDAVGHLGVLAQLQALRQEPEPQAPRSTWRLS